MATFDHMICVILVVVGAFNFDVTTCHKWPNSGKQNCIVNVLSCFQLYLVRCRSSNGISTTETAPSATDGIGINGVATRQDLACMSKIFG